MRNERQRIESLRFAARSLWDLDQLGRTLDARLQAAPELRRVTLDLSDISTIDDSGIASVDYLCTRLKNAGVDLLIEGCDRDLARTLSQRNLPVATAGPPAQTGSSRGRTLH